MNCCLKAVIKIDKSGTGAQNMQRDFALWEQAQCDNANFFYLRIYQWQDPTITHGLSQRPEQLFDLEALRRDKIEITARTTGGRALLHHHEITYALGSHFDHPVFGGGLLASYQKIAGCLCLFLEELGLSARISANKSREVNRCSANNAEQTKNKTPLCYASVGFMEITLDGKKFIGSAQKRGKSGYLQHGSIPIARSSFEMLPYLLNKQQQKEPEIAVLADYLDGAMLDFTFLADRLAKSFVKLITKEEQEVKYC